jgi:uncharacterized phage infection (PIP) family protein YhgE
VSEIMFTNPDAPPPTPPSGSSKTPLLLGAIIVLVAAVAYQFYAMNQLRTELTAQLDETKEMLINQLGRVNETHTVSSQTNKRAVDQLKAQVEAERRRAAELAGTAREEAEKHADELAGKLETMQKEQEQRVKQVATDVGQVKEDASATKSRVGEVATDLSNVKTEAAATKSELEKTISDLKSTRGDLGVQSGLIATNSKELAALRQLGERNYTEFKLAKEKTARKVGDLLIKLKAADPKKNRYTIEVTADDKLMEKKDRTINEPVQLMLSKATIPFEIVVNDIKKDMIAGYVSAPKVQQTRN